MLGVKVSLRQIMLQSCRDGGDTEHWAARVSLAASAGQWRQLQTTDSEELLLVVMTEEES